jgi:hypothetical protein
MLLLRKLSAKVRIAAAVGATLLATTAAAAPAYAATASHAAAPAAATSGCTGSVIPAVGDHNHVRVEFWYGHNGCIGTIKVTVYDGVAGVCTNDIEVRVYSQGHRVGRPHIFPTPTSCIKATGFTSLHQTLKLPVMICARANIAPPGSGRLGSACAVTK